MASTLYKTSIALVCLTCIGYGRRLQTPAKRIPGDWITARALECLLLRLNPTAAYNPCLSPSSSILANLHPLQGSADQARHSHIHLSDGQDVDLWASLRARQKELDAELVTRWRKAEYRAQAFACQGWVRRVALEWPLAAIGTADGQLLVADVSSGDSIATQSAAHPSYVNSAASNRDMQLLYGEWDGGGLTALAFRNRIIVSAGRDGGAKIWRLVSSAKEANLMDIQEVARLKDPSSSTSSVVSRIKLTGGHTRDQGSNFHIWLASLDGKVQRWDYDIGSDVGGTGPLPDARAPRCTLTLRTQAAVLDMAILEERGLIACSTANGGVELFSIDSGEQQGSWYPLAFDGSRGYKGERARSVAFIPVDRKDEPFTYCVVVGGSDGSMHARFLAAVNQETAVGSNNQRDVFDGAPPPVALLPSHRGACVAITAIGEKASGLFVSGAHDGTCRMWDLDWRPEKGTSSMPPLTKDISKDGGPACRFGLTGFKPWLGSLATDGKRLVSDGRDNAVVVLDFSSDSK